MGPFVEAVRATWQPCTFLLVVPVTATAVVVGNRWRSLVAILIAAVVGGWLVAANRFVLDGVLLRLAALGAALALVAAVLLPARDRLSTLASERVAASVAGAVTLLATMWWRPCVGNELGSILTGAQRELGDELWPMALYMIGAMAPIMIVALAQHAIRPTERVRRISTWVALGVGVVVMSSLVGGQHDRVVVTLTRWTVE